MTSKERAFLRSKSNNLKPVVTVGKDGLTDEVVTSFRNALSGKEIIKFRVLNNSDESAKGVLEEVCAKINAEPVSCVGNVGVIYKKSSKLKEHVLDELAPKKETKKTTGHKPCSKAKVKRAKEREESELKDAYIKAKIKESKAKKEGKIIDNSFSKKTGKKLGEIKKRSGGKSAALSRQDKFSKTATKDKKQSGSKRADSGKRYGASKPAKKAPLNKLAPKRGAARRESTISRVQRELKKGNR